MLGMSELDDATSAELHARSCRTPVGDPLLAAYQSVADAKRSGGNRVAVL